MAEDRFVRNFNQSPRMGSALNSMLSSFMAVDQQNKKNEADAFNQMVRQRQADAYAKQVSYQNPDRAIGENERQRAIMEANAREQAKQAFFQDMVRSFPANLGQTPVTRTSAQQPKQQSSSNYRLGQTIVGPDGKNYRVVGGDPNDPDVELIQ